MIDPIATHLSPQQLQQLQLPRDPAAAARIDTAVGGEGLRKADRAGGESFSNVIGELVRAADDKTKVAAAEARSLMVGESDNIHRTMIALQESGLAFNLLVEVRNKLVQSYQELMRMPV